ncbi:MAG: endolytic transglycosylase MltG [Lachnospiraceae bacterium]|nr:endolytic transglycosylase MltG [Lachnospiraceae bacterium]
MAAAVKKTEKAEPAVQKPVKQKKDLFHYLKILIVVLFFVLLAIVCYVSFRFGVLIFTNDGVTDSEHAVTYTLRVEQGESVYQIGRDLETHGIIENRFVFMIQSKLYKCTIAPGTFTVNSGMSSKEILKYLNREYIKAKDAVTP